MAKKILFLITFLVSVSALHGEWMQEASLYFKRGEFSRVVILLSSQYEKNDQLYNPTISALLAYSARRLNDERSEYQWMMVYFEYHWGQRIISHFLEASSRNQVEVFVADWRNRYPLISDINLIDPRGENTSGPPKNLVLALEVENAGLFKLIHDGQILKGSLLQKGLNTISVPTDSLFSKSGTHVFLLEFKVGPLIVRKEIEIDVQMDDSQEVEKIEQESRKIEYLLSLYVGDQLIVTSRRAPSRSEKSPYEPHLFSPVVPYEPPIESTKVLPRGFNILGALGLAAQVIRGLTKKKVRAPAPPVRKVRMMNVKFIRRGDSGEDGSMSATIRMKLGKIELRKF